jgi:hypothetical protein
VKSEKKRQKKSNCFIYFVKHEEKRSRHLLVGSKGKVKRKKGEIMSTLFMPS